MSLEEWKTFIWFMKQYLALEDWFHCANDKAKVISARRKIGKILKTMQTLFPRGDGTNGYNIPKMHGMAKMVDYICLFGSGINFFGGPGESSHKQFVKSPGLKTQRRVSEFASQVAKQHYHVMVSQHVYKSCIGASEKDSDNVGERTIMEGKYTSMLLLVVLLTARVQEDCVQNWCGSSNEIDMKSCMGTQQN
jgi:hypothetical protein